MTTQKVWSITRWGKTWGVVSKTDKSDRTLYQAYGPGGEFPYAWANLSRASDEATLAYQNRLDAAPDIG